MSSMQVDAKHVQLEAPGSNAIEGNLNVVLSDSAPTTSAPENAPATSAPATSAPLGNRQWTSCPVSAPTTDAPVYDRAPTTNCAPLCCLAATLSFGLIITKWRCGFNVNNSVECCGADLKACGCGNGSSNGHYVTCEDCCIMLTCCAGCGFWGWWVSLVLTAFCC